MVLLGEQRWFWLGTFRVQIGETVVYGSVYATVQWQWFWLNRCWFLYGSGDWTIQLDQKAAVPNGPQQWMLRLWSDVWSFSAYSRCDWTSISSWCAEMGPSGQQAVWDADNNLCQPVREHKNKINVSVCNFRNSSSFLTAHCCLRAMQQNEALNQQLHLRTTLFWNVRPVLI